MEKYIQLIHGSMVIISLIKKLNVMILMEISR